MKHSCISILKRKNGIAIMSVMLFFMVMTIFTGTLTFTTMGNARVSGSNTQSMAAFYAAEAGTNVVLEEIRILRANTNLSLNGFITAMDQLIARNHGMSFSLAANGGSIVRVNIENTQHDRVNRRYTFNIVSTGEVQGQTRTLSTFVEVGYGRIGENDNNFRLRHAILVRNEIRTGTARILSVSNFVTTRIATLASTSNSLNLDSRLVFNGEIELTRAGRNNTDVVASAHRSKINSTILVDGGDSVLAANEIRINFPTINFSEIRNSAATLGNNTPTTLNVIAPLVNGSRTIQGGIYNVDQLNFVPFNNTTITIDADVFIITNQLTLANVTIVGNGTLTVYVNPQTNLASSNFVPQTNNQRFGRESNPERLVIYVDSMINNARQYDITFPPNSFIGSYIMLQNANVYFQNNARLFGSIFTGAVNRPGQNANSPIFSVSIMNGSQLTNEDQRSLIVAPNGTVNFENNTSMRGAIIAQNVDLSNGVTLTFDPDFPQRIPFDITSPISLPPSDNFGINQLVVHQTIER